MWCSTWISLTTWNKVQKLRTPTPRYCRTKQLQYMRGWNVSMLACQQLSVCFGGGHRTLYKRQLYALDVLFRNLCRSIVTQAYLVAAPGLSVWPFWRHSVVRPPYTHRLHECQPSCQEYRPDQTYISNFFPPLPQSHSRTALNSRGLKTQPCRTPPVLQKIRLLPHSPMTSPSCSSYAFSNNYIQCSGTPCSRRASHMLGKCTRSNAFDKSKLTTHTVIFQLRQLYPVEGSLSTNVFQSSAWSNTMLFLRLFHLQNLLHTAKGQIPRYFAEKPAACNKSEGSRLNGSQFFTKHSEVVSFPRVRNAPGLENNIERCKCLNQNSSGAFQ